MRFEQEFSLKGFGNRINKAISQICTQTTKNLKTKTNELLKEKKEKKLMFNEKLSKSLLKSSLSQHTINLYGQKAVVKVSALKQETALHHRKMG